MDRIDEIRKLTCDVNYLSGTKLDNLLYKTYEYRVNTPGKYEGFIFWSQRIFEQEKEISTKFYRVVGTTYKNPVDLIINEY